MTLMVLLDFTTPNRRSRNPDAHPDTPSASLSPPERGRAGVRGFEPETIPPPHPNPEVIYFPPRLHPQLSWGEGEGETGAVPGCARSPGARLCKTRAAAVLSRSGSDGIEHAWREACFRPRCGWDRRAPFVVCCPPVCAALIPSMQTVVLSIPISFRFVVERLRRYHENEKTIHRA